MYRPLARLLTISLGASLLCAVATAQTSQPTSQPDSPEEEKQKADPKAIEIADRTMEAMGGREAWDNTRYISWTFFGVRSHVWDKHTGRVRIEVERDGVRTVTLMNLNDMTGQVYVDGEAIADDKLPGMLARGRSAWINDSYWLVMPYKLRDPGVVLRYVGEGETQEGNVAEVLELTFEAGAGNTPQNKYRVYVGAESGLVEQWDFYREADDEKAGFISQWTDWKKYGNIMLSGDRGEMRGRAAQLTDIEVHDELPDSVFSDPAEVELGGS